MKLIMAILIFAFFYIAACLRVSDVGSTSQKHPTFDVLSLMRIPDTPQMKQIDVLSFMQKSLEESQGATSPLRSPTTVDDTPLGSPASGPGPGSTGAGAVPSSAVVGSSPMEAELFGESQQSSVASETSFWTELARQSAFEPPPVCEEGGYPQGTQAVHGFIIPAGALTSREAFLVDGITDLVEAKSAIKHWIKEYKGLRDFCENKQKVVRALSDSLDSCNKILLRIRREYDIDASVFEETGQSLETCANPCDNP